jgi:hypothetical protein
MRFALRQISIPPRREKMFLTIDLEVQGAFDHVEKALGIRVSKLPTIL